MSVTLTTENDQIILREDDNLVVRVRPGQFKDFCFLVSSSYEMRGYTPITANMTANMTSTPVRQTLYLAPDALTKIQPTFQILADELRSVFTSRASLSARIANNYRLDLENSDLESVIAAAPEFINIPHYQYTTPLSPRPTEGRANYGDLLIRFARAAKGENESPQVEDPAIYNIDKLQILPALVNKDAIDHVADKGAYRIVHFKPEYDFIGRAGHRVPVNIQTPLTCNELEQKVGRALTAPSDHTQADTPAPT